MTDKPLRTRFKLFYFVPMGAEYENSYGEPKWNCCRVHDDRILGIVYWRESMRQHVFNGSDTLLLSRKGLRNIAKFIKQLKPPKGQKDQ